MPYDYLISVLEIICTIYKSYSNEIDFRALPKIPGPTIEKIFIPKLVLLGIDLGTSSSIAHSASRRNT